VREGDAGGDLYVVLSGAVRVVKNHGTPDALHLGDLGAGSYFGEMAIFDDRPRSATVIAAEPTRVLVLAGDRLKELVLQSPEIAFQIFEVLTTRIREVERRLDRLSRGQGGPPGDA
jgi:CRP-like cAMP-binding protein